MQSLFPLAEGDHDVADAQNNSGKIFGEMPAGRAGKRDPIAVKVSYFQTQGHLT
jgi:hypothetical protein